ncbi:DUF134 domain-containing protein [Pseudaeromonas paramecii]|uniref:UPF0251 protein GCM10023095_05630 n=1 Tax=Pseudaeromonas paramecii TaxID=2138166 RepID=A0ABP8PXP0_9GAMM
MPRPKIARCIQARAPFSLFKPNGIPSHRLTQLQLAEDEFEALRLADLQGLQQQEAAKVMGISRQTFANLVKGARRKVAYCLVEGAALALHGEDAGAAPPAATEKPSV